MPADTDGQAHLFFAGNEPLQIMAVSTTGCIAVQSPENPIRIFYWYYRSKGKDPIAFPPMPWLILWSCRAPWNTEQCGHITRLHVNDCSLTGIDARDLSRLAHLRCDGNLLERLDCSGMTKLKSLDCSGNDLTYLNVDGCHRLTHLRVGGNRPLRETESELLARARGEYRPVLRQRLTATSLFDL
jgi:Leucine-rich repeat (LRR) protein